MALWSAKTCQWVGPEQDPQRNYPLDYCGKPNLNGKNYCHEHYFRVYDKGTSVNGRRASKAIQKEIEEIQAAEELAKLEEAYDV